MTELSIKTLGELVENDKRKVADVKRMIEEYGVYVRTRWHEWEAAPAEDGRSKPVINAAISALGDYADIFDPRSPIEAAEEFYKKPNNHDIFSYGFNQDNAGQLYVKNTRIQSLEEQIERLKEENRRLGGNYEPSIDKELIAPHLELANQVYREALEKRDPKTNKVEGKTPRIWMEDRLAGMGLSLKDSMIKTIATVANWRKVQVNPPKK